jgi:hypothetical protein
MPTWNKLMITKIAFFSLLIAGSGFSAGLDKLSKSKPEAPASKTTSSSKTVTKPDAEAAKPTQTIVAPTEKPTPVAPPAAPPKGTPLNKKQADDDAEESAKTAQKAVVKPVVVQTQQSKALENRLSLATSLGWAVVKPANGTWTGIGASDISARWRESNKGDGKVFITARYAPVAGVWTVDDRDYDTTLHGIFGGAEYEKPIEFMGAPTIKAGVELGYMLVYAKPQDKAEAASDVKGGKVNLAAGGGADWAILNGKIKVGPFARLHFVGFTIVNVGGSVNFVF